MNHVPGLECVALLLIRDHQVLAEKHRLTKALAPGTVAIPGGHVETGESVGHALAREAREEFGIVPRDVAYVCTLLHQAKELRTLHYFAAMSWEGAIVPDEAESVAWIPLTSLEALDFDVDKTAVNEYLRLEREGGLTWHPIP